ncbi:hypothetical protein ABZ413_23065 [Nocardia rhamnosiphila]|uniref:hypothetical protein n=1 Tax=Nocardia rhamnosiphila TaxID=426716 RepID=UPI0033E276A1
MPKMGSPVSEVFERALRPIIERSVLGVSRVHRRDLKNASDGLVYYADRVDTDLRFDTYFDDAGNDRPGRRPLRFDTKRLGILPTGRGRPIFTGLGSEIDSLVALSPTMSDTMRDLYRDAWTIRIGRRGAGSFTRRATLSIVIDENRLENPLTTFRSLAHELGHARRAKKAVDPSRHVPFDPDVITREQWIDKVSRLKIREEGHAQMFACRALQDLVDAGMVTPPPSMSSRIPWQYNGAAIPPPIRAEHWDIYQTHEPKEAFSILSEKYQNTIMSKPGGDTYLEHYREIYSEKFDELYGPERR